MWLVPILVLAAQARVNAPFRDKADTHLIEAAVTGVIDRSVASLLAMQQPDGSFRVLDPGDEERHESYPMGVTAFALYALLEAGLPADDPAVERGLRALSYCERKKTYGVATAIMALDATGAPEHDEWILESARWLEAHLDKRSSLWGYPGGQPELSNTQFAILGLWTAERHGHVIAQGLWPRVLRAVTQLQARDGGFGYRTKLRPESAGSMTTAGIAVLELGLRALADDKRQRPLIAAAQGARRRAWDWLDKRFTSTGNPAGLSGRIRDRYPGTFQLYYFHHFYLWGLERAAALADRKQLAGRDWYRACTIDLLRREHAGGGFGALENTALALLFLRRSTAARLGWERASLPRPVYWQFCTLSAGQRPESGWMLAGLPAESWSRGAGAFGQLGAGRLAVRSQWLQGELWLRRELQLVAGAAAPTHVYLASSGPAQVFIDGVEAARVDSATAAYVELELAPAARAALADGQALLAAHASPSTGDYAFDLRFTDPRVQPATAGWWRSTPRADVPFIRRWLTLGPISDAENLAFLTSALDEAALAPGPRQSSGAQRWEASTASSAPFDLEAARGAGDACFFYAFTHLEALEACDAILWLGTEDAVRIWLDGEVLLSHPCDQGLRADRFGIDVHFEPGMHRLLIKLRDGGARSRFYLRLTGRDLAPLTQVRPLIDSSKPQRSAAARAHPELYELAELLELLPTARGSRFGLERANDVDTLALTSLAPYWPRWTPVAGEGPALKDAKGLLGLVTVAPEFPARILQHIEVAPGRKRINLRAQALRGSDMSVRVALFDGELKWMGAARALASGGWRDLQFELPPISDRDVLLVIEVLDRAGSGKAVWLDGWELR